MLPKLHLMTLKEFNLTLVTVPKIGNMILDKGWRILTLTMTRFGGNAAVPMNEMAGDIKQMSPEVVGYNNAINADLFYTGEKSSSLNCRRSLLLQGVIGAIPPVYYELQQKSGGNHGSILIVQQTS